MKILPLSHEKLRKNIYNMKKKNASALKQSSIFVLISSIYTQETNYIQFWLVSKYIYGASPQK